MKKESLRNIPIRVDNKYIMPQSNLPFETVANVKVIFHRQKEEILEYINQYNSVMGCVAWLTDGDILKALATKEIVSIIVQKEDFLRPDLSSSNKRLQKLYASLPTYEHRKYLSSLAASLSIGGDQSLKAIRCMGNHNSEKSPSFPRMHHKFLVFTNDFAFNLNAPPQYSWTISDSDCVWTGSYNLSYTSQHSLENVVVLRSEEIVRAYIDEWSQMLALSEPLDWESPWCAPEWRIGT